MQEPRSQALDSMQSCSNMQLPLPPLLHCHTAVKALGCFCMQTLPVMKQNCSNFVPLSTPSHEGELLKLCSFVYSIELTAVAVRCTACLASSHQAMRLHAFQGGGWGKARKEGFLQAFTPQAPQLGYLLVTGTGTFE